MNVLLLGSGGREHAILRALRKSACVDRIHAAPGNAGMSAETPCHRVDPLNPDAVIELAYALKPDLVIIGPEGPLCLGVADARTDDLGDEHRVITACDGVGDARLEPVRGGEEERVAGLGRGLRIDAFEIGASHDVTLRARTA